jgi:Lon protease-like protein
MQGYLPLFPLQLVAYPLEDLNLHIFEMRYRQLINECLDNNTTFGIPTFIDGRLPGFGTEIRVKHLAKLYEDGRMDINTQGIRVFRILDFDNPAPNKLYAGGEVEFFEPPKPKPDINYLLLEKIKYLYELLDAEIPFDPDAPQPYSYQVAHKIGLSIEQEYELLKMPTEAERQAFLMKHLDKTIPMMEEMERTRDRIRMNGHFKNLDPLNF